MIRDYRGSDAAAVLAINEECVPEVNSIGPRTLEMFARVSPFLKVVEVENQVVGFMVGLTEEAAEYQSKNYGWFCQRHEAFAYVDRIAFAATGRGQGWGPALYEHFEAWARQHDKPVMSAEVNTIPDNPRSHRFHELFGFVEVARRRPYGPDEEVAMYDKSLI